MGKHATHDVSQWLMGVFFLVALGMSVWGDADADRGSRNASYAPRGALTQPSAFAARTIAQAP